MGSTPNDFSIIILPFHGGINFRPLLPDKDKEFEDADNWHDCSQNLSSDEYFSDLDVFVFVRLEGSDKTGNRVVGKYFPAVGKDDTCPGLTILRLYWKIKYVSRLQYLSEDIKKGEVQIPDFVKSHNKVLEDRPLADYGIDPIPST
ncbi:rho GTPase-activating protein 68F [Cucumis melo var. makuwa]|uniref:Rho GTPase-activating protein 68F n=1 Tax=Cucumis melo var. makuwa TaxID=1194695 RepID=A0A5D3BCP2_CUCMM|nr:rho GTPase-activating protein 68F [Cucumis melo var. makuwa]